MSILNFIFTDLTRPFEKKNIMFTRKLNGTHLFLKAFATARAAKAPFSLSWFISDDALNCESLAAGWLAGRNSPVEIIIDTRIYKTYNKLKCFNYFTSMNHIGFPFIIQIESRFECMTGSDTQSGTYNWNSSISFTIFTGTYRFYLKCLKCCVWCRSIIAILLDWRFIWWDGIYF